MTEDLIGKHKSDLKTPEAQALCYQDSCEVTKAHPVKGQATVSSHTQSSI